jgi:hypothetical protein
MGFVSSDLVLAPYGAKVGDHIHQPGPHDAEILTGATRAGTLGTFVRAVRDHRNEVSAAVTVLSDNEALGNIAPKYAPDAGRAISAIAAEDEVQHEDLVAFVGRTSGYSEGQITAVCLMNLQVSDGEDSITYNHCIEVSPKDDRFCAAGDSGALVWRRSDMKAVGLILAGADEGRIGYLLPIARVFSALEVSLF